ncbi:hypothetical protein BC833DRAFT_623063 [Globomyces pollinis-pini]|nr:hypothetical protein BC833DRAFT_623063 [Globomyces pollinis-pini]
MDLTAPKPISKCGFCESEENFKLCVQCRECGYCSKECQKNDWVDHKLFCKAISKFKEIANLFETNNNYKSLLNEYATKETTGFELNSRRLVQFSFKNLQNVKMMADISYMSSGGHADVDIKLAKPTDEERGGSQWAIAMDYTNRYDMDKEYSVVFTLDLPDDIYLVKPFIINK